MRATGGGARRPPSGRLLAATSPYSSGLAFEGLIHGGGRPGANPPIVTEVLPADVEPGRVWRTSSRSCPQHAELQPLRGGEDSRRSCSSGMMSTIDEP